MKKTHQPEAASSTDDDMAAEYAFDYTKARPNRFAQKIAEGSRIVIIEPDVAKVFTTPESVNTILRALIATMPKVDQKEHAA
jgi:hypothetical protein